MQQQDVDHAKIDHFKGLCDKLAEDLARAKRQAEKDIETLKVDNHALREHLARVLSTAQETLEAILQRTHRFAEIYGLDFLQKVKQAYIDLGGDPLKIPSPEMNRVMEERAALIAEQDRIHAEAQRHEIDTDIDRTFPR
jgi:small-conductance mechanosensitive channel